MGLRNVAGTVQCYAPRPRASRTPRPLHDHPRRRRCSGEYDSPLRLPPPRHQGTPRSRTPSVKETACTSPPRCACSNLENPFRFILTSGNDVKCVIFWPVLYKKKGGFFFCVLVALNRAEECRKFCVFFILCLSSFVLGDKMWFYSPTQSCVEAHLFSFFL